METRRKPSKLVRASTKDVLGSFGATTIPKRIPGKWRQYHDALVEFRNRLAQRRGTLAKDVSEEQPAYSLHMADVGTDTYDRDFALSIASSEQDALYEVDQAINRIQDGSYGICEITGEPIAAERLKAIPWTRFSTSAEHELERNGSVKRAKLGELADVPKNGDPDREDADEDG